jgi:hypothetical protein
MKLLPLQTSFLLTFVKEILPQTSVQRKTRFLYAFSFPIQKKLTTLTSLQLIAVSTTEFRRHSNNSKRRYASSQMQNMQPSYFLSA